MVYRCRICNPSHVQILIPATRWSLLHSPKILEKLKHLGSIQMINLQLVVIFFSTLLLYELKIVVFNSKCFKLAYCSSDNYLDNEKGDLTFFIIFITQVSYMK